MMILIHLSSLLLYSLAKGVDGEHDYSNNGEETPDYAQERSNVHGLDQDLYEKRLLDSSKPSWVSALSQAWTSPERTIDLSSLGIDLGAVFDRLLSPAGIVNQYALSIAIQLIFIVGYILTGKKGIRHNIVIRTCSVKIFFNGCLINAIQKNGHC